MNDIDKYISAEIPDSEADPILYNTGVNNMIHGPCDGSCIIEGQFRNIIQENFKKKL